MPFFKSAAEKAASYRRDGKWEKAAEQYAKAGQPAEAAEIYHEQLHDLDRAVAAWDEAGQSLRAAEVLMAAGRSREAIGRYQAAGSLKRAAEASQAARQPVRAGGFYEQAGQFALAVDCYVEGGELERAAKALAKEADALRRRADSQGNGELSERLEALDSRRADLLTKLHRHTDAARLLADLGRHRRAAEAWERADSAREAAMAYLEAGLEGEAERLADAHPELPAELRAQIYAEASRPADAARLFDEIGKHDAAARAFEEAGDDKTAAEQWKRAGSHSKAAELYVRIERFYEAAQCYAHDDRHLLAAEHFLRAGAPRNAADAFLNAEPPQNLRAGELYLEAGKEAEALDVLQSIRPGHVDYPEASLLVALPLLAVGSYSPVAERLKYLQERSEELDPRQLLEFHYLRGRLLENRKPESAASAYRTVVGQAPDHRDAAARLEEVEERLRRDSRRPASDSGTGPLDLEASGWTRSFESQPHSTRRVPLKPSTVSTGSMPVDPMPDRPSRDRLAAGDSAIVDLPVEIVDRVSPWWNGADFLGVRDRESGEPLLMVSFPMALVGEKADSFQYILRQIKALRHQAILQLQSSLPMSDKVLLFYEHFDGVPLADELGGDHARDFSPRTALYLLLQLCEALTSVHKLGLTHQWLSPRTILVDRENRCKMVGLGLREFLAAADPTSRAYLSPEVAEEGGVIGPTSDVYSLGLLAMQLLDAQLPIDWRANLDPEKFGWPQVVMAELPSSLRNFLVRCLSRDPLARPSTAELAAALTSIGLSSGQMLANRYEVVREIGRGGMSRVYRAVDTELGGEVAIKTVLTPALGRTDDEERLYREAQISRRITHSNVVRVHDLGRFPGGIFIIMELLEGPGLDEVIENEAPLEPSRVRRILIEVASALSEAHRMNVVHRDLKPGNVILVDGRVKVLDFGIARAVDSTNTHLTRTGEVIGSPLYMSPEQIQGHEVMGTSDLYSLGVIGYTLLTGREPFAADSPTAVIIKHLEESPPDLRTQVPDIEEEWVALIERLLQKKPADRYATAEELVTALQHLPD